MDLTTPLLDDSSIYPFEIESYLNRHENVRESCVFGLKVNAYEEVICAWVILKDAGVASSADELRSFCLANFAESKVPKFIKFVDNLATHSMTGKIQRSKLAEAYRLERKLPK